MNREFSIQYLRQDGEPEGPPQLAGYSDARTALELRWPGQCDLRQLHHCIALSRAAPGHPVDAVAIHEDRVLFSARITHQGARHGQA